MLGLNVPENYIVLDMQTEQRLFMVTQVDDDAFDIMAKNERIFLKLLESKKEFSIGGIKQ
jgi:glycyl-tRNA synthetase beta subunit